MQYWNTWMRQPQTLWVRKAAFQVHLWVGIVLGVYVVAIGLSGSVLVYRPELSRTFSPEPVLVEPGPTRLSQAQLEAAAEKAFAGYKVAKTWPVASPRHAVQMDLARAGHTRQRLFNPYTGEDLGNPLPAGFRFTAWLLDFHDNLLGGRSGRHVNAAASVLLIVLCLTGMVVWWPGLARWRRSAMLEFKAGWKQATWSTHSALGIWCVGFILMWGITGAYLSLPEPFDAAVEYLEPFDESNPGVRVGDRVTYWLAYAHFGRFGGRIPGCARASACNEILKAGWTLIGLVPVIMAVSGAIMWWNRHGRRAAQRFSRGRARTR